MKFQKEDYFTIFIIISALILLTLFPPSNDSFISRLIAPIKKIAYNLAEDIANLLDRKERVGFKPESGFYTISDFEKSSELSKWRVVNSKIRRSKDFSSEGKYSGEIDFYEGKNKVSKIFLRDFPNRWSNFKTLGFDIYNPNMDKFRVILQLKDRSGDRFKKNLYLMPESENHFNINISEINEKINTKKINEFNLFRWKPKSDKKIFIDNIKLYTSDKKISESITSKDLSIHPQKSITEKDYIIKKSVDYTTINNIKIIAENPNKISLDSWHCTGKIHFPKGHITTNSKLTLKDQDKNLSFQITPLNSWTDSSIKTAFIDFNTDFKPKEIKKLGLFYGDKVASTSIRSKAKIKITDKNDEIIVSTGPLKFSISKKHFTIFKKVWRDINYDGIFDQEEIVSSAGDIELIANGIKYFSSMDYTTYHVEIENRNTLRVEIIAEGMLRSKDGVPFCKYITRIHAYNNETYLRIYQDFKSPKQNKVQSIAILIPYTQSFKQIYSPNTGVQMNFPVILSQTKKEKCEVRFGGRKLFFDRNISEWIDVSNSEGGLTIVMKSYWKLLAKRIFINKKNIIQYLIPPLKSSYNISTGISNQAKINQDSIFDYNNSFDLMLYYHSPDKANIKPYQIANAFLNPITIKSE